MPPRRFDMGFYHGKMVHMIDFNAEIDRAFETERELYEIYKDDSEMVALLMRITAQRLKYILDMEYFCKMREIE